MKRTTKRKIKNLFNKNSLLFTIVTMMSTGYALLSEKLTLNGNSNIKNASQGNKDPEDMGDICTAGITFNLRTSWGGKSLSI